MSRDYDTWEREANLGGASELLRAFETKHEGGAWSAGDWSTEGESAEPGETYESESLQRGKMLTVAQLEAGELKVGHHVWIRWKLNSEIWHIGRRLQIFRLVQV